MIKKRARTFVLLWDEPQIVIASRDSLINLRAFSSLIQKSRYARKIAKHTSSMSTCSLNQFLASLEEKEVRLPETFAMHLTFPISESIGFVSWKSALLVRYSGELLEKCSRVMRYSYRIALDNFLLQLDLICLYQPMGFLVLNFGDNTKVSCAYGLAQLQQSEIFLGATFSVMVFSTD
ncbi:hypothetical protein HUJ04_009306 [Dendroctonus ponderosae]|nr:hypothetical protein HUJ04_009306 [Dendroctonus ponderosae]